MLHPIMAFLAGLFLVLSSHFASADEAALKEVNRALASPEPVVLIGVPAEFLHPETIENDDAIEAQSDWEYYLSDWREHAAKEEKLKVIVVPIAVLSNALQAPVFKTEGCAVLFIKNRTLGLLNDGDDSCVLQFEEYDVGAKWLQGSASASEISEAGYKLTPVAARARK